MFSSMVKEREGYQNVTLQLPLAIWQAVQQDADARGESATRVLTEILRCHYHVPKEAIPPPRRAGRKPKQNRSGE